MSGTTVALFLSLFAPQVAVPQDSDSTVGWIVDRLREELNLTEEQVAAVRETLKEANQQRDDRIRQVLTEEQKERFAGVGSLVGRNLRGRAGGGRDLGLFRNFDLGRLREEFGLTDEQVKQIEPLITALADEARERMARLREEGFEGFNWEEELARLRARLERLRSEIEPFLTEEQKQKVRAWIEDRAAGGFGELGRGERRGTPGGGERESSVEQRVNRAMDRLAVENEEEAAAIRALVQKTAEFQERFRGFGRDSREELRGWTRNEGASEEEIEKFLDEWRARRNELQKSLWDARNELRALLSYRQELQLLELGILE